MLRLVPLLLLAGLLLAQGGGRDPWSRLQRMDADGDGKVSRDEFTGPDRLWGRLDRDGDGFVTEGEAGAMRRGGRRGKPGGRMTERFDGNEDGKISAEEWTAFFEKADENGDAVLDPDEMSAALAGRRYEDKAPRVGAPVPQVKAKRAGSDEVVDLARAKKTTVLVFGSWT